MNTTNRTLNRLLLLLAALILLGLGAAAGLIAVIGLGYTPGLTMKQLTDKLPATSFSLSQPIAYTIIGLGAVLTLLLLVSLFRRGRGHTDVAFETGDKQTRTIIELGFVRELLTGYLATRPEFLSSRVSTYRVHHTPTLKLSVQCKRGLGPDAAVQLIEETLRGLDAILGVQLPVFVQLTGGFRANTHKPVRVNDGA